MIARGGGDDAARTLLRAQAGHFVVRAAQLEREHLPYNSARIRDPAFSYFSHSPRTQVGHWQSHMLQGKTAIPPKQLQAALKVRQTIIPVCQMHGTMAISRLYLTFS